MRCANFTHANLYSANLSNTDLTGSRFVSAILDKANLTNAYLGFTNCTNASIRGVRLLGACLMRTQLQGANLLQSSLSGAWIYETDLAVTISEKESNLFTQQLLLDIEVCEREKLSMQTLYHHIQQREGALLEKCEATISIFVRDPNGVAYVRLRSDFRCEMCGWLGFVKDDGNPYVEVHHLKPLSDGGQDTPENTAALCPNCHRHLHHGRDRKQILEQLVEHLATKGIYVLPC